MTFKIIIDPKTGKAQTQSGGNPDEIQKKLEKTRKEVKDMVAGNTPFHVDPNTPEPEKPEEIPAEIWSTTGYWGHFKV